MVDDQIAPEESAVDFFSTQIDILIEIISRPVVQLQLVVLILILIIAWFLPEVIQRRLRSGASEEETRRAEADSRTPRLVRGLYYLMTPILALLLLRIARSLLAGQGYPSGLLENVNDLIWIWLIYRVVLSLLYTRFGERVHPYRVRIVTPIFIYLLFQAFLDVVPGSGTFAAARIGHGPLTVTLGDLLTALVVLYVFVVAAWAAKEVTVHTLPSRVQADASVIGSVATLASYALLAIGIVLSLAFLGLDLSSLAIVAGGLSVGIGIGLQDIVANFVSGLALLFEQSLRPGDVIQIGGRITQVEKVSLRATTVRTRTNEQLIVPNNTFTSTEVMNYTKSERLVQIVLPFGVSYKSDPAQVKELAVETGLQHRYVLPSPPPQLLFRAYGDSSLDFDLIVSTSRPELTFRIKSDLYYMLWQTFAENGIEIPYPQRDLNLGSGWEKLAADLQKED